MSSTATISCLNNPANASKHVLYLGGEQSHSQSRLIDVLIENNCYVDYAETMIDGSGIYDFVVSFGYRHILSKDIIAKLDCPILNLHISYLPYNRAAHPNFWSFYDNTPAGVTIHLIDDGIDTGPIIYQRYVNFDRDEITFAKTYKRLIKEIEALFEQNIDDILAGHWVAKPQRGAGTIHFVKDFPSDFAGWDAVIEDEIVRLDKMRIIKNN